MHSSSGLGQGCRRQAVKDGARAPPPATLPAQLGLIASDEPAVSALVKGKVLQRLELKFSNVSYPVCARRLLQQLKTHHVWDQVQQHL